MYRTIQPALGEPTKPWTFFPFPPPEHGLCSPTAVEKSKRFLHVGRSTRGLRCPGVQSHIQGDLDLVYLPEVQRGR